MSNLINGRTPEEIKSALNCKMAGDHCQSCSYQYECLMDGDLKTLDRDALALIERLEATLERLGDFGKLFMEYTGCPRGAMGRAALSLEKEVLAMKPIRDVDGGEWIPVNADALRELVSKYKKLCDVAPKWIGVKDKTSAPFVSVQAYMTDAGNFPPVREGYMVDEGFFYIPALKEIHPCSHWTELAKPPEVDT